MKMFDAGVTAPKGFVAGGVKAAIKKGRDRKDLAIIFSEREANAAAVYTRNKVKAAPVLLTMENLAGGKARAVIANSGNANACTGAEGMARARRMVAAAAKALGVPETQVIVASTGVIGQHLNIEAVEAAAPALAKGLSKDGGADARDAIMTTDTIPKQAACEFEVGGKKAVIGAICKGSGMIHPNMGTMLCFIATDCAVSAAVLKQALGSCVERSFNRVTVDGDTSTNDMAAIMANGLAGNAEISGPGADYDAFEAALLAVLVELAKLIAKDGEGATKLIECAVTGAKDEDTAAGLAKAVVGSSLVKAAFFGADANWGRILCAMGYSGCEFDPAAVSVGFSSAAGSLKVCDAGQAIDFSEELAKKVLGEGEIRVDVVIAGKGEGRAAAWGCDLTYDYVKINGDYRT